MNEAALRGMRQMWEEATTYQPKVKPIPVETANGLRWHEVEIDGTDEFLDSVSDASLIAELTIRGYQVIRNTHA